MIIRTCNAFVTLLTSIESLEPPSFWYNSSDNGKCTLFELLRLEDYVFLSILKKCGLIRQKKLNGIMTIFNEFHLLVNTNELMLKFLSL